MSEALHIQAPTDGSVIAAPPGEIDTDSTKLERAAAMDLSTSSWALLPVRRPETNPPENVSSQSLSTPEVALGLNSNSDTALKLTAKEASRDEPSKNWLQLGFMSYHQNRAANFNERNLGLGWEHHLSETTSTSIGFYENSVRRNSIYATYNWQPLQLGPVKIGVMAGVINGYPRLNHGNFMPIALPVASIEGRHVGANFMCIPPLKDVSAVCAVQVKVRF